MASTLTNLLFHCVFSTKHRDPLILPSFRDNLHSYIGGIIRSEGGVLIEAGGMPDHVPLLIRLKPVHSVSAVLKVGKSKSSKWANEEKLVPGGFYWQTGYGAFTVSVSQLAIVARYIQNQETHHHQKTFQDEVRDLLNRHEIEFDETWLWD